MIATTTTIYNNIRISKEEIKFICELWEVASDIAKDVADGDTDKIFLSIIDDICNCCFAGSDLVGIPLGKYYTERK